jgi:hypothetical protein
MSWIELTLTLPAGVSPFSILWLTVSALYLGAVLGFALARSAGRSAVVAFLSFAFLSFHETSQWPGDVGTRHAGRLVLASLLGWLLAYLATHRQSPASRAASAHHAACGVAAAGYVLCGITKLHLSGIGWIDGGNLALLIAERSGDGPLWLQSVRAWVATMEVLPSVLAAAGLTFELCGVAFLWPRARRAYAIAGALFQLGVVLLLGYFVMEWVILLVALAFFPPREGEPSGSDSKSLVADSLARRLSSSSAR